MSNKNKSSREAQNDMPTYDQEHVKRVEDAKRLVFGIVGRHAEFFADPDNRIEFFKNQTADDVFRMAQYVNAKVRGEKLHELRKIPEEKLGSDLPSLHTPESADKQAAFGRGYDAIREYLDTTEDGTDKQIQSIAMASEALIIWVHPFSDGNGRTSRFIGKLIEEGATDMDSLVEETASFKARPMYYKQKIASRESQIETADNEELMLDDDERDEIRENAKNLPDDIEAMYLSVKGILEDATIREDILRIASLYKRR